MNSNIEQPLTYFNIFLNNGENFFKFGRVVFKLKLTNIHDLHFWIPDRGYACGSIDEDKNFADCSIDFSK